MSASAARNDALKVSRRALCKDLLAGALGMLLFGKSSLGADKRPLDVYARCAQACEHCAKACRACHKHCRDMVAMGMQGQAASSRLTLQCMTLCLEAQKLCAQKSPKAIEVCRACLKACHACDAACRNHLDMSVMTACSQACIACAAACQRLIMAHSHPDET